MIYIFGFLLSVILLAIFSWFVFLRPIARQFPGPNRDVPAKYRPFLGQIPEEFTYLYFYEKVIGIDEEGLRIFVAGLKYTPKRLDPIAIYPVENIRNVKIYIANKMVWMLCLEVPDIRCPTVRVPILGENMARRYMGIINTLRHRLNSGVQPERG